MNTYKSAGVDIEAGHETVERIKSSVRATFNPRVLADLGMFGGLYDAKFDDMEHPVLVASTDGVGTKLKVAVMANRHSGVGQDLVNHCVNDILACGARPLFFLDYFATGALDPDVASQVIIGAAQACKENGCALIGGETAEMPSIYARGDYDLAGTIVGIVEKSGVIPNGVQAGDVLIALASTGLHTNGYSLARSVLFPKYDVNQHIESLGTTLAEALLAVHRSYFHEVYPLIASKHVKALSHITGGGIIGNTTRIVPSGLALDIDWDSWKQPPLFDLIQTEGDVSTDEMRKAFNLGVGMILVVDPEHADYVLAACGPARPWRVGSIVNA